jgi:hypothetical protein
MLFNEKVFTCFIFVILFLLPSRLEGQIIHKLDSIVQQKFSNRRYLILPSVEHAPETSWAFGLYGLSTFKPSLDDTSGAVSNVKVKVIYSLLNQFTTGGSFLLFGKDRKWASSGRVTYQYFPYRFWGIGRNINLNHFETYEPKFVHLNTDYLRKVKHHFYLGGIVHYENYISLVKEQGNLLQSGDIVGSEGGSIGGLGPAFMFDSRDNVINAGQGFFSKFTALSYQPFSENLEKYQLLNLDLRYFYSPSDKHTIALQHISTATFNEAPFFQLPMIGGEQMMRGYYRGAYRDNHLNALQAEYRLRIWKNIGMVLFGSTGWISEKVFGSHLNEALISGGTGFRYLYDKDKKINMRLDLAWGQNSFGVYFGIGEAF